MTEGSLIIWKLDRTKQEAFFEGVLEDQAWDVFGDPKCNSICTA